ncbi:MAG: hypothetical protein IKK45_07705 [Akkermansia sp.]|nr:hypothetical protein [Akkermansia sp.]
MVLIEHKEREDGSRYLVSAYPLEDNKETKVTRQFKKLVYCKYSKYNKTAKFTANAPQGKAYELLRAAISGGHTDNVATKQDIVNWKAAQTLSRTASVSLALEPYTPAELAESFLRRMAAYMRNQARRYRLLSPRMPKDTQAALFSKSVPKRKLHYGVYMQLFRNVKEIIYLPPEGALQLFRRGIVIHIKTILAYEIAALFHPNASGAHVSQPYIQPTL